MRTSCLVLILSRCSSISTVAPVGLESIRNCFHLEFENYQKINTKSFRIRQRRRSVSLDLLFIHILMEFWPSGLTKQANTFRLSSSRLMTVGIKGNFNLMAAQEKNAKFHQNATTETTSLNSTAVLFHIWCLRVVYYS